MGTLFDYVKWRGDLSFTEAPFNEVDSLIFSLISYVDFEGIVSGVHGGPKVPIKAAANAYFTKNPDIKKNIRRTDRSQGYHTAVSCIEELQTISKRRAFRLR